MKKYRATAGSPVRVDYGIELAIGLELFPETAGYAAAFRTVNNELETAYEARRASRKPLVEARVALRYANYSVDQLVRSAARGCEIADGGRRGPVFQAVFPDNVNPVVAPAGARQIKPTEELIARITHSKAPGMDAFRTEWLPKLQGGLDSLQAAATAHQSAQKAYLDAFQLEVGLRAEHLLAVDRLIGQVRAAFPRDRTRQDLVFPVVDEADSVEAEGGDTGEPSSEPAPTPA